MTRNCPGLLGSCGRSCCPDIPDLFAESHSVMSNILGRHTYCPSSAFHCYTESGDGAVGMGQHAAGRFCAAQGRGLVPVPCHDSQSSMLRCCQWNQVKWPLEHGTCTAAHWLLASAGASWSASDRSSTALRPAELGAGSYCNAGRGLYLRGIPD